MKRFVVSKGRVVSRDLPLGTLFCRNIAHEIVCFNFKANSVRCLLEIQYVRVIRDEDVNPHSVGLRIITKVMQIRTVLAFESALE